MAESSNIIVVDGHTYTWEWQFDELLLMSDIKDMVFIDVKKWLEDENHQVINDYNQKGDYRGAEDFLWDQMNDQDNIEWYVNKFKETATVIKHYED
jgi:hypothetical protein